MNSRVEVRKQKELEKGKPQGERNLFLHDGESAGRLKGVTLSLSDLEIPTQRLLTAVEERLLGYKIRRGFDRIRRILPETLPGYRRYLLCMEESLAGGRTSALWFPLRKRMEKDHAKARDSLERVAALAPRSAGRAILTLQEGLRILRRYPLDLETIFSWSRLSAAAPMEEGALRRLTRPERLRSILARTVKAMEDARDRLVLPNLRLILKEVFRYHPVGMRRSDLFQEGILGLHRAIFRYDPARGTRFSTYATYWIRQSIRKALIDRSRLIRVPQAVQEELRNPETALSRKERERLGRIMKETISLTGGEEEGGEDRQLLERIEDRASGSDEKLHTRIIPGAVASALGGLDPREREVVRRRYGLEGEHSQTLEEIGTSLNLSRERIRQIEVEALKKMSHSHPLQEVYENLEKEGD